MGFSFLKHKQTTDFLVITTKNNAFFVCDFICFSWSIAFNSKSILFSSLIFNQINMKLNFNFLFLVCDRKMHRFSNGLMLFYEFNPRFCAVIMTLFFGCFFLAFLWLLCTGNKKRSWYVPIPRKMILLKWMTITHTDDKCDQQKTKNK